MKKITVKSKKQKVSALLAMLLVSTLPLSACNLFNKGDSSSTDSLSSSTSETPEVVPFTSTGDYCYGDTTLTIDEATCCLVKDGATVEGTYSYDGTTLSMTFADGKTATATLNGTVLTVTMDGVAYSYYKKIAYTVTFSTGESAQVYNGQTVAKPTDPEKANYWFVGWYADAEYTKPYDFNAIVTGDVSLYARFIKKVDQQEFAVTLYVDGEVYEVLTTRGGKLYNLPTPTVAGKMFLGWYVSASEDGSELSYKYAEQLIGQDTALFAVWSDASKPIVSVNETNITWTKAGEAGAYNVTIKNAQGDVVGKVSGTRELQYAFNFASLPAGAYTVEVSDVYDATVVGKAYFNNKVLDKVCYFTVAEDRVLTWNEVPNATQYLITVVCGDTNHSHVQEVCNNPVYDFSACQMKAGGITFTVEAIADGYQSSVSKSYSYEANLDEVTDLKVDDETEIASWGEVANAEYYVVEIIDDGVSLGEKTMTETSVSLKGLTGTLEVKVYAWAKAYNASSVQTVVYQNNRLATPIDIALDGTNVVWGAIENATGYVVKIGNQEYSVSGCSFALQNAYFTNSVATIYVKAVCADDAKASRYSNAFVVRSDNKMDASTLDYNAGVVTWGAVLNSNGYGVRVNYGDEYGSEVMVAGNATSCAIEFTKESANATIEVRSYSPEGDVSDWVATAAISVYKITFDVLGGVSVDAMYKATNDPIAQWPTTSYTGYEFDGWYDIPNALENNGNKVEAAIFQGTSDVTYYAGYNPLKYTVSYNAGSLGVLDSTSQEVTYSKKYALPVPTCTDSAKVFKGWYTETDGKGVRYTDMYGASLAAWSDANDNVVLHAAWYEALSFVETTENGVTTYAVEQGADASEIEYLTIPAVYNGIAVTSINSLAFANCNKLLEINIPDSVKSIYLSSDNKADTSSAFVGCTNLRKINIYCEDGDSCVHERAYDSDAAGALLYNNPVTGNKEIKYLPLGFLDDTDGVYEIGDGVQVIPTSAFYGRSLKKIIVPASVTQIDSSAFEACKSLTEIIFLEAANGAEELPLVLSSGIFKGCDKLTVLNLPKRVANLETYIFPADEDAESIFSNKLTDINITGKAPAGVSADASYYSIAGVLFYNDTLVYMPRAKEGIYRIPQRHEDVQIAITKIGDNAANGCTYLTELSIPMWVTSIGENAFRNCSAVTTLTFEAMDLEENYADLEIKSGAFYYCSGLERVDLPVNLKYLGANAFYASQNDASQKLKTVAVNSDASNFEAGAFSSEGGVFFVNNIYLGASVEMIEISGIFGTYNVQNVYVDENNQNMVAYEGVIYNKAETEIIYFPYGKTGDYAIRDTVERLGDRVFAGTKITSISIPASVTEIGAYTFAKCTELTSIEWQPGTAALTIGEGAFAGVTKIENFVIPARVTYIGQGAYARTNMVTLVIEDGTQALEIADYAFKNVPWESDTANKLDFDWVEGTANVGGTSKSITNGKLVSVTLPTRLTKIGAEAFYYAFNVKESASIVVPEGVEEIGNRAFAKNSGVVSVSLPSTLVKMGAYNDDALTSILVFDNCAALTTITVANGNTKFTVIDGVLYGLTDSVVTDLYLAPAASAGNASGNVDIPKTVVKIWDNAFKNNAGIKSVTFSEGCESTLNIGEEVFSYSKIESIELPEGLTVLSKGLFKSCTGLTQVTVPSTVSLIEAGAFYSCSKLTAIYFAESVGDVVNLTIADAIITQDSSYSTQKTYTTPFASCSNLKTIALPERTTSIGQYAFYKLAIETITIPASVTSMGERAFSGCKSLTTVNFAANSQLAEIARYTFENCTSLASINVPASVATIAEYAFTGCKVLANVNFAEGVTTIGEAAFKGTVLTSIALPASLQEIGANAFENCAQATSISFAANSKLVTIGDLAFAGCMNLTEITIPAMVETIGEAAFNCCEALAKVDFEAENNMKTIGDFAFAASGLTNFSFPDSKNTVAFGVSVFEGCDLAKVHLSKSVDSITNIFDGATIGSITVDKDSEHFSAVPGQKVLFNKDGSAIRIVYGEIEGELDLSKVSSVDLIQIGEEAFINQTKLTSIKIPASVKEIQTKAFKGCTSLQTVTFVDSGEGVDSQLNSIDVSAFEGCTALTAVKLPANVTTLGNNAFYGCTSLASVELNTALTTIGTKVFAGASNLSSLVLPEGLTTIGNYMFAMCGWESGSINENNTIVIPSTVTSIGEGAFAGVESVGTGGSTKFVPVSNLVIENTADKPSQLTSVGKGAFAHLKNVTTFTLPNSVTTLGTHTFIYCEGLQTVTLPDGIKTLEQYMFDHCYALSAYTIPSTVTTIGNYAFNFSALTEVTIPASVTSIGNNAFSNTKALEKVTFAERSTNLTIGNNAFSLSSTDEQGDFEVNFCSSNITTIGTGAFAYRGMTEVELPASVTKLGGTSGTGVFQGCQSLTTVTFGSSSLTQMGVSLFQDCVSLNNVTVRTGTTFLGITSSSTSDSKMFQGCTSENFTLTLPDTIKTFGPAVLRTDSSSRTTSLTASTKTLPVGLNITSLNLKGATKLEKFALAGCQKLTDITFGTALTTVNESAFANCTALTSLNLSKATSIAKNAFWACTALQTADISKMTSTNASLFYGCTSLKDVTFSGTLTTLPANCFEKCTALTTFTLPAKMVTINTSAFKGCTALTEVTNLSQATNIGSSAFEGCTALTSADMSSVTATNFAKASSAFKGCTALETVTLPTAAETIPASMFAGCTALEQLAVPSTVTFIGANAFSGAGLKSIDLSATKIDRFSNSATGTVSSSSSASQFTDCVNLEEVKLPESLAYIGVSVFSGCTSLTTINWPSSLTLIAREAFKNTAITSFTIGSNLVYLDTTAFLGCALENISAVGTNDVFKVENGAAYVIGTMISGSSKYAYDNALILFSSSAIDENGVFTLAEGCTGLVSGVSTSSNMEGSALAFNSAIKEVVLPSTMTSIGAYAFANMTALERITIPASVTYIGKQAFKNCTALTTVIFEDEEGAATLEFESAANNFFAGCSALETVHIPARIRNIPAYMFGYSSTTESTLCVNLQNVTIAEGVESIGDNAFNGTAIESIDLPSTIKTIGKQAFANTNLTAFAFSADIAAVGEKAFAGTQLTTVTIPAGDITWTATFSGVATLETVVVEEGVTAIPASMFTDCVALTSIDIPESVTSIGASAFKGCTSLATIDLPEGLTVLGESAFQNCTALTSIAIPDGVTSLSTIASTTMAKAVTASSYTFDGCTALESVTLPANLAWIGGYAFRNCTSLTELDLPEAVAVIAPSAFAGSAIKKIEVKNPNIIMYQSFMDMTALEEAVLPEGLTALGYKLFYNCESLRTVNIPSTVTTFATVYVADNGNNISTTGNTFQGCHALESIVIPDGVTEIPTSAFAKKGANQGDTPMALTSIKLPANLQSIAYGAFAGCSNVTSIVIPKSAICAKGSTNAHFKYWTAEQTIYIEATKGFVDRNWANASSSSNWATSCNAKIVYNYKPAEEV